MSPTIAFIGLAGACAFSKPEVLAGSFYNARSRYQRLLLCMLIENELKISTIYTAVLSTTPASGIARQRGFRDYRLHQVPRIIRATCSSLS
jgi:hypothetical protein